MPANDDYTDDYVAELLKKDARATSSAASNLGLGSLLTKRPTGAAPKPNTRFLKNLIRDTDTHNAALLAKEAEESRARLQRLREEQKPKGKPERQFYSARSRHDGTSGPPSKRRRLSPALPEKSERGERHHYHDSHSHRSSNKRHEDDRHVTKTRSRRDRSRSRSRDSSHEQDRSSTRRHGSDRNRRRRTRSPDRDQEGPDHHHHHHHERSRRHRSRSTNHDRERQPHRSKYSSSPESVEHRKSGKHSRDHGKESRLAERTERPERIKRRHSSLSDSDPLEAIIGPPPPPPQPTLRSKGRGAFNRSTIDSHFNDAYDPSADLTPDVDDAIEGDDWDSALEALRDRQKWRQQGAERLRAAGFSEVEVEKWASQKINSKGEREMDEADVRWGKMGEGREWDRGKVVDGDDGSVSVMAEWGRLKGT